MIVNDLGILVCPTNRRIVVQAIQENNRDSAIPFVVSTRDDPILNLKIFSFLIMIVLIGIYVARRSVL